VLVDVGPPLARSQAIELGRAMRARRTADARLARLQVSPDFERRDPKVVEQVILNIYAPFFRDQQTIDAVDLAFTDITAANVLEYEDRLVESLAAEDPTTRLATISCPTPVIHGEIDPVPVAFGRSLADSIAGAQFAPIPGASHFPFIEDREPFERVLRPFLASVGSSPS
jgi:proline iminopeptidase